MIDRPRATSCRTSTRWRSIRKPDGKLGEKVLGTTKAVKDECKESKDRPLRLLTLALN